MQMMIHLAFHLFKMQANCVAGILNNFLFLSVMNKCNDLNVLLRMSLCTTIFLLWFQSLLHFRFDTRSHTSTQQSLILIKTVILVFNLNYVCLSFVSWLDGPVQCILNQTPDTSHQTCSCGDPMCNSASAVSSTAMMHWINQQVWQRHAGAVKFASEYISHQWRHSLEDVIYG